MLELNELRTPRGATARMHSREGTSDLAVLGSTYEGVVGAPLVDEYGLAGIRLAPGDRIADVGAHIGSVGIAMLIDNPGTTCVFVEPLRENADVIRMSLHANGLTDRAEIIDGAVGTDTITYMWSGSQTAEDNRFIGNLTHQQNGKTIAVRRVGLDELLPCAVMKIDCEGGEWGLLADPAVCYVPLILGEYHGGEGADGIRRLLGATHDLAFADESQSTGNFRAVRR